MSEKSPEAFRTISEVAAELDLPQHVLRFWETKFSHIRPLKRSSGRRFYRPEDVALLRVIREMLYGQGYTIRGVQRLLKERGRDLTANERLASDPDLLLAPPEVAAPPALPIVAAAATAHPVTLDNPRENVRAIIDHGVVTALDALAGELRECAAILANARQA